MYIKNREKLEKALANLIKEMINQEMVDENKKEVADQLSAAREYEIRQICEDIADQYVSIKKPL
jgi:hypothetical protein